MALVLVAGKGRLTLGTGGQPRRKTSVASEGLNPKDQCLLSRAFLVPHNKLVILSCHRTEWLLLCYRPSLPLCSPSAGKVPLILPILRLSDSSGSVIVPRINNPGQPWKILPCQLSTALFPVPPPCYQDGWTHRDSYGKAFFFLVSFFLPLGGWACEEPGSLTGTHRLPSNWVIHGTMLHVHQEIPVVSSIISDHIRIVNIHLLVINY